MAWDLGAPLINSWTRETRFFQVAKENEDIRFDGAPFRLNDIMSQRRFEEILSVHVTHTTEQPSYVDPFHPVREFFTGWNDNMKLNFVVHANLGSLIMNIILLHVVFQVIYFM